MFVNAPATQEEILMWGNVFFFKKISTNERCKQEGGARDIFHNIYICKQHVIACIGYTTGFGAINSLCGAGGSITGGLIAGASIGYNCGIPNCNPTSASQCPDGSSLTQPSIIPFTNAGAASPVNVNSLAPASAPPSDNSTSSPVNVTSVSPDPASSPVNMTSVNGTSYNSTSPSNNTSA
uniref:SFRICE_005785 n=1 Tax=Spodoptera frugiperda TaxID=7108 RepID=A0A2H1WLA6_SPOFR